jgi:1,2-diacylglycerol 3-beta-galactosyltransferase
MRLLLLFSDTGGGHRSAAEALIEAWRAEHPAASRRLLAQPRRRPVRVEGFVTNMPEWMAAADVLATKAGPGTITEGLLSGLPLVLIGKVPGQEDGNVDFVVGSGVGAWAPDPTRAAATVRDWLGPGSKVLAEMSARARRLVSPDAASDIAADVLELTRPRERAARSLAYA